MPVKDLRQRAAVTLLHNVRNRRMLARLPFVASQAPARRTEFVDRLPEIVAGLVNELGAESASQRRRFAVLRKSDIEREEHAAVARELGLSRSQFYRDLRAARECFADALESRLRVPPPRNNDARFVAVDALRDGGRFEQAARIAKALAGAAKDTATAMRALCLCAELQTECGLFAAAKSTMQHARSLIPNVAGDGSSALLAASCDLVEFEIAHCQGKPASAKARQSLIERLRRGYESHDPAYAAALIKALIDGASLLFERDEAAYAHALIEEAQSVVAREGLEGTRLGVDVAIRASGIRALAPDNVAAALDETAGIVETGTSHGDVRTLRLGMQMMSAHLLTLGRLEEARHYALEAWALIDLFGSPLDRLIVLSNLARIDIHRRDGNQALAWIAMAQALNCNAFSITQALTISRAEALVLVGKADSAATLARSSSARVRRWPRLLGRAKLAEATALHSLNRSAEARVSSAEAVELSRGCAGPLLHLRALDLNVRLTGNISARNALRDLQAALCHPELVEGPYAN
ncbi:MAG TPA: hypothetical protein VGG70_09165 [Candidatus Cybelea sp.]